MRISPHPPLRPGAHVLPKLRRLAAASPREIAFRLRRHADTVRQRWRFTAGRASRPAADWIRRMGVEASEGDLALGLLCHMESRAEPPFLLSLPELARTAAAHARHFPDRRPEVVRRAEEAAGHRFSFLGIGFTAVDPISWQRCPATGYAWPRVFHADVAVTGDSVPDVKYTWELNRHGFLVDCGQAYRLTGETRFAAAAFRIIDAWIGGNPFLQGINWSSALEVAMRALAWLWTFQLCRGWHGWDAEASARFVRALGEHGDYLFANLSFYSSPYNHLVGEATALYFLGCFLPELDCGAAWRQRGWDVLAAEVEKQFHPDGGSVEQATSYHHLSLGFFLLAMLQRMRRGEDVPAAMSARLERALEFSMWMTRPDGRVPSIGDADDARSIAFEKRAPCDFRNLLGLGAVLFRRADMKHVAGPLGEDVLWLLGVEGCDAYLALEAAPPSPTARLFAESGYSILRSGWGPADHFTCFDCGPIAAGVDTSAVPSAAHGHADILSFELSAFGVPLVVDPGCHTYGGDRRWHSYFRDSAAHNTVRVNGRSQARSAGMMTWSNAAIPEGLRWTSTEDRAEGGHSGFEGLGDRVRHRRAIVWEGDGRWSVLDRLEGSEVVDIEVFFHLSAACEVVRAESSKAFARLGSGALAFVLECVGPEPLALEVIAGGDGPGGGWVAPSYGCLERAPVLRFHGRRRLPASFAFACTAARGELNDRALEVARAEVSSRVPSIPGPAVPRPPGSGTEAEGEPARVLEVGPYPPPYGGWSTRIAYLRRALEAAGHDCVVLNLGATRAIASPDYECVRSPSEYVRKLVRYAAAGHLFHLHINGSARKGWLLAYIALGVALASGRHPVLTFHAGTEQKFFPRRNSALAFPVLAALFRACSAVVCNHEGVRRLIIEYGVRPERVFSFPAVSPQYLENVAAELPAEAEAYIATHTPVLLGWLEWSPVQAPEAVLRALAEVVVAHPGTGVILVAPAADVPALRGALGAVGLAGRTCLLDPLDHGQFLAVLKRADVYVRSSSTEGASSSVAEALALGIRVVANHGAHPDGVVGYRFGDTASLVAALNATLGDRGANREEIRPPLLGDTLALETELLVRCARAGRDRRGRT